nr:MAG TPA: hypothetical protein [Caudoviricetes sp.]
MTTRIYSLYFILVKNKSYFIYLILIFTRETFMRTL